MRTKRFFVVFLILCIVLTSAFSCKKGESSSASTKGAKTIKVGMVTDVGGINDQSFNQTSWEGLKRAGTELGIDVIYLESHQDSDYATNLQTLIESDCDLIIAVGYMLSDATRNAALKNPNQKFAIVDDAANADLPNVACLMFEQATASYLVGVVAGLMTKTNTVGFVLGMSTGPMNEFGYGYLAGVKDSNPNCTIEQYNANNFADPGGGATAARSMHTKGADIIFHAAGGTGNGVISACEQMGIYAIGVDTDQSKVAPNTVITSAMKRVDNATFDVASSVLNGTYKAGLHTYGLESGGVDIAPTDTLLPENVKVAVQTAKNKILNGEIKVPANKASFEAKYGNIYTLD